MAKVLKSLGFGGTQMTSFDRGDPATAFELWKELVDDLKELGRASLGVMTASVAHDFGILANGAGESKDVTVPGAALGDFAIASLGVDASGLVVTANVKSADVVTVRAQNWTGASVDLASTTLRVAVIPLRSASRYGLLGVKTHDFGLLAAGAGESVDVPVVGADTGFFAVASLGVDASGLTITASPKMDGTVTVRAENGTAAAVDLPSTQLRVLALSPLAIQGFLGELTADKTNDFAQLANGAGASLDVAVPGAAVGDFALASLQVDVQGQLLTAYVKSNNVVTVRLQNRTGVAIDLPSTTVRVVVFPKSSFGYVSNLKTSVES